MNTLVSQHGTYLLAEAEKFSAAMPSYIRAIQQKAMDAFENSGLPTTKHEEWKYTNIVPFFENKYSVYPEVEFLLNPTQFHKFALTEHAYFIVFENGRLNSALSASAFPKGVTVGNIRDHYDHPEVKKHLAACADFKTEALVAMNTAFLQQGAFIHLADQVVLDQPVYLLNIITQPNIAVFPRHLIVAGKSAAALIIATDHTTAENSFTNAVTEVILAENSNIELVKLQDENASAFRYDHTEAVVEKNAVFHIHTITTGGKLTRNDLHVVLNDRGGNSFLNGLYIGSENNHIDNHTLVDHAQPDCYTNELYKGILSGKSHGVFNGKIMVRKDAQKTNAYQSNKNILVSDEAVMNAKPQLEIYADDVKCSHGTTTGQLDNESIFYLRSRGIGFKEAKALLTVAFAEDVINKISSVNLRERLNEIIHSKLNETL